MTVYVTQIKGPRLPLPEHADKGFLTLKEYLQMAQKIVKHVLGKINSKVAKEILRSDDVLSNIATSMMMSDWKYQPGAGTSPETYRYGGALQVIKTYLKRRSSRRYVYSLDYEISDGDTTTKNMYDDIEDNSQLEPADYAITKINNDNLIEILEDGKTLNDKERLCINKYFFNDMTYQAIGDEIGVTRERIRQIIKDGLLKLRAELTD